ncbi:MAG TPA: AMP-binding protein [Methylophilaceae bacterium]|jgi:long-subunit acyl-CoA synthetase (AMP-forming)
MSLIMNCLRATALQHPQRVAFQNDSKTLSYGDLVVAIDETTRQLHDLKPRALGLYADNSIAWALSDLSALNANIPLVPLPLFFSSSQLTHVIFDAGLDAVLTDRPQQLLNLLKEAGIDCESGTKLAGLDLIYLQNVAAKPLPADTLKITYTSGTTAEPKGVCLAADQIEAVAVSLRGACQAFAEDRHLCLTPLSTLLENIGGIYVPLLAGAHICLPPLRNVGIFGAAELDAGQMINAMHTFDATSVILAPQMLHTMILAAKFGKAMPPHLRFVAVGGAPVSKSLLEQAAQLGLPVYEGYGLSECASVVALNTAEANRRGSVGKPLPHNILSFAEDGEILLGNPGFLGYLGQDPPSQPWPTGDIGYLDVEGFLYLRGRKKNMFITSFGRNVAPEWVETELNLHPAIAQVAVFGEARPFNAAVIVLRPGFSDKAVEAAIEETNRYLPDYARISQWVAATKPFTADNGQLTSNGRLKRDAIKSAYSEAIDQFYEEQADGVF